MVLPHRKLDSPLLAGFLGWPWCSAWSGPGGTHSGRVFHACSEEAWFLGVCQAVRRAREIFPSALKYQRTSLENVRCRSAVLGNRASQAAVSSFLFLCVPQAPRGTADARPEDCWVVAPKQIMP